MSSHTRQYDRIGSTVLMGLAIAALLASLGFGRPGVHAHALRPYPDTVEPVWQVERFIHGKSPIMPIGHELHPPRYSPVHPAMMAAFALITGGKWQNLFFWSPVALSAGLVFLYLAMGQLGMGTPTRVLSILVISTSSMLILISQNILQESTIFLLLCVDVWISSRVAPKHGRILLIVSGLIAGALISIRPTYLLWPLSRLLYSLYTDRKMTPQRIGQAVAYSAAGTLVLAAQVAHNYLISGCWNLYLYNYWHDTSGFFSWKNLTLHESWSPRPPWQQLIGGLAGIRYDVSRLGVIFHVLLYAGILLGAKHFIRQRPFFLLLLLFAALQVVAHTFYRFSGARFAIAIYPWLVITAVAGWEAATRRATHSMQVAEKRVISVAGCCVLAATMLFSATRNVRAFHVPLPDARLQALADEIRTSTDYGKIIRSHKAPLFIEGMDTVAARLLFGLTEWRQPIYQASGRDNWWGVPTDGHYCELDRAARREVFEPPCIAGKRPQEIYVVKDGRLDTERLESILTNSEILICINGRSQKNVFGGAG